jgi:hypothetical protein
MQMGGRQSAQDRALAGSKDSGEVGGFHARSQMSDSVHPSVLAQEVAGAETSRDLPRRHARIEELRPRNHPMPSAGDSRDLRFDRPAWSTHTVP